MICPSCRPGRPTCAPGAEMLGNPKEGKNKAKEIDGKIALWQPIKRAWLVNLNEEREEELPINKEGSLNMKVGYKKIVSIELLMM